MKKIIALGLLTGIILRLAIIPVTASAQTNTLSFSVNNIQTK